MTRRILASLVAFLGFYAILSALSAEFSGVKVLYLTLAVLGTIGLILPAKA